MKAGTLEIEIVAEIARLQADLADARKAIKGLDDAIRPANDNLPKFGKGAQGAGNAAKLAGHQVQNLAYQMNDLVVGLASGQKPMTVFMQQGSQIAQIMAQARIGVGGLAKEVAGMVGSFARAHPVLTAVAAATAAAASAMAILTREVNSERKSELDAYVASLGLTKEEVAKLGPVSITAGDAMRGLWSVIKEGLGLDKVFTIMKNTAIAVFNAMVVAGKYAGAGIYAALAGSVDGTILVWKSLPGIIGEAAVGAANLAIAAVQRMINNTIDGVNALIAAVNWALNTSINKISPVNLGRIENQWAGAGKAAANGVIAGYNKRFNEGLGAFDAAGQRISDAMVQAAKDRLGTSAGDIIDDRTAGKIKDKAGKAGKDAGDKFAEQFLKGYYEGLADLMDGNKSFMEQWEKDVTKAWNDLGKTFQEKAKVATDYTSDLNEELRKTVDLLDRMGAGGLGNIGAALVGLTSGDFSGVSGKGGALLQLLGNTNWRNDKGQIVTLREEIVKGLDSVFGDTGSFAKTMNGLLQGAGMGVAIGGIVGGSKGSALGGSIGGALGQLAGEKLLTKALGSAAGPIGAIAGSLLGGIFGSLFSTVKKGVATFSGTGLVSTSGNSKSRIAGATAAGGNVIDALAQIADAFGADIGDASFSLGIRKKSYTLDPTGQGRTKGAGVLNFGQDSEAAIKAAIKDAISDGVFEGLSAGVERLLKGDGDIEKQLKKALDFQGVFDDLAQRKDPTAFGLGQLEKQFGKLRDIFEEAGASTEEYAQLEELYQAKRADIIEEGNRAALEKERARRELEIQIMALEGKGAEALAASRALELEALEASLRPMQERIFALQDEAAAAEERHQLEYRMAQALGDEEKILTMRREDELAAVSDLNKVYLQQVQAAEAAAAAVAKAAAAQNAAKSNLQGLSGMASGGIIGAAGNPAIMSALGLYASGDVTGARNALATYISNNVAAAMPDATAAVKAATINQIINGLSPQGTATYAVTAGMQGGNKKPGIDIANDNPSTKEQERLARLDDLHSRLTDAYERERKAIEDVIEPLRKIREQFADFKDELNGKLGGRDGFAAISAKFIKTSALAATGDVDAMGALVGVSRDYLGAAKDRTSTLVQYQRFAATVRAAIDQADMAAADQIDYNEEQLKALDRQVEGQIETNKKLDTIADLLKQLNDETGGMRSEQRQLGTVTAISTRKTHRTLDRTSRGGTALATETVF